MLTLDACSGPREPPRKRLACTSHANKSCPYAPNNFGICSNSGCSNALASCADVCESCASGSTPCLNLCMRRAAAGYNGYCVSCSTMASQSRNEDPSVAASTTSNKTLDAAAASTADDWSGRPDANANTVLATSHVSLLRDHALNHACKNFPLCARSLKQVFAPRAGNDNAVAVPKFLQRHCGHWILTQAKSHILKTIGAWVCK